MCTLTQTWVSAFVCLSGSTLHSSAKVFHEPTWRFFFYKDRHHQQVVLSRLLQGRVDSGLDKSVVLNFKHLYIYFFVGWVATQPLD